MKTRKKVMWLLVIMFTCYSSIACASPVKPFDPIEHYNETGEWISGSGYEEENPRLEEADYSIVGMEVGYDTQEEADAAFRVAEEERAIREWERIDTQDKLRRYDELAIKSRETFNSAENVPPAFTSPQGYVMFPYGVVVPKINCRPYRVSDIALEPGESIIGIHAGDTVRWLFSPSISMQGNLEVAHIIIKPTMPGISTNLMIHTDRRAYHIDLISTETDMYTPGVAFTYPNTDLNLVFGVKENRSKSKQSDKEEESGSARLDKINTGYKIVPKNSVRVDWKPLSVFDDGLKTYIRMPGRISEAPALYIRLDGIETLVNYRVKDRYYVVDRLFDRAYLRVGKKTIVIIRNESLSRQNEYTDEIRVIKRDEK